MKLFLVLSISLLVAVAAVANSRKPYDYESREESHSLTQNEYRQSRYEMALIQEHPVPTPAALVIFVPFILTFLFALALIFLDRTNSHL